MLHLERLILEKREIMYQNKYMKHMKNLRKVFLIKKKVNMFDLVINKYKVINNKTIKININQLII